MKNIPIQDFQIGQNQPLAVMSGPCVIESEEHCLRCAESLQEIFVGRPINFIFKASYDKANRTSISSFRGPGIEEGLRILQKIKEQLNVPIVTDVHTVEEAVAAAAVCDVVQIPAFLCRQTDLLVAAAQSGAVVSVKKGQFMAPWDMENVVEKIRASGNEKVMLVDRGSSFGYNNLVSDMRAIPIMQGFDLPVCFDATHSVQLPGGQGSSSGGQREFIPTLAKAAIAAGANCLFLETHPDPKNAKSDAGSVMDLKELPRLLDVVERLYDVVQGGVPA